MREKVFVVSDTHFPFHSQKALDVAYTLISNFKPTHVVQIGDLLDALSLTKFPKSLNIIKPKDEIEEAINISNLFWMEIRGICGKKTKYWQLKGNHCDRGIRRIIEKAPELESIVANEMDRMYKFPGVTTINDSRDALIIQDTYYCHGWSTKHGAHIDYLSGKYNVVHGHTHRGAVVSKSYFGKIVTELDVGFLGDVSAPCFNYTLQKKTIPWTLGCGMVDELGHRFIPIHI